MIITMTVACEKESNFKLTGKAHFTAGLRIYCPRAHWHGEVLVRARANISLGFHFQAVCFRLHLSGFRRGSWGWWVERMQVGKNERRQHMEN